MTRLGYERYCDEIVVQAGLFRAALRGADLKATVPTCPDWSIGDLARHVGGALRWMAANVRSRAQEPVAEDAIPDAAGPGDGDPAALDAWLGESAALVAAELRAAGPDTAVWTWADEQSTDFWARRAVHETVIHRADAAIAANVPYALAPEVAADTLEEWLEIGSLPQTMERRPELARLLGPGRTIHLHATDTDLDQGGGEWLIDLTGEAITWRRGHEKAAVALRGPMRDLLLVFYRRLSVEDGDVAVIGDRALMDEWLELVSFG
ncbi:maleylpyruvate isomerase family mycothiol-dependent enzyme [Streptomyces sp. NPDC050315]|uniref:maleylpyruvate isomerase family mycothiol-dependent enzyme n=1 Tax=Streptomyces sp. NPDC050315 TaxID=3155039 RepID=UPI0034436C0B